MILMLSRPPTWSVCLFGLSASPPTGLLGHGGIVKHLVGLKQFDEVRELRGKAHPALRLPKLCCPAVTNEAAPCAHSATAITVRTDRALQVWVLPVFEHMHEGEKRRLASFEHRMEMCRLAFEKLSDFPDCRVIVKATERAVCLRRLRSDRTSKTGTADILDQMRVVR